MCVCVGVYTCVRACVCVHMCVCVPDLQVDVSASSDQRLCDISVLHLCVCVCVCVCACVCVPLTWRLTSAPPRISACATSAR